MTVAELIAELQKMPQDKKVYICGTAENGSNEWIEPNVAESWDKRAVFVGYA